MTKAEQHKRFLQEQSAKLKELIAKVDAARVAERTHHRAWERALVDEENARRKINALATAMRGYAEDSYVEFLNGAGIDRKKLQRDYS